MNKILITGATGNVGTEVINALCTSDHSLEIIAAVRDVNRAKKKFRHCEKVQFRAFDLERSGMFHSAFKDIDILFLLRPPHISDVDRYFIPLLRSAEECGIRKILFLSVQGAEKFSVIPHNKIERLIKASGFQYIFIRPGYFMQNLTTTLLPELTKSRSLSLPAGDAKFNWIDVKDIGEVSALLAASFDEHVGKAYEITGRENKSFGDVLKILGEQTGISIQYIRLNPISFFLKKKREGMPSNFALVMTFLHFLPRIQNAPNISNDYITLTGREPTTLREFIDREKDQFI